MSVSASLLVLLLLCVQVKVCAAALSMVTKQLGCTTFLVRAVCAE
jgi:hypothetical protein